IAAGSLAAVPDDVELETAAAVMLQGLTAHYLVNDTWPLQPGQRCLLHAGAGGVGLLLIQMAKAKGAEVFATVGNDEKAALASAAGADHVIVYSRDDFTSAVEEIAGPRPIDVVYDGVGKATFAGGMALLRKRGLMVTFGNASGPVDPVSPLELSGNGSLFLTRPSLFDYIATAAEFETKTSQLLTQVASGALEVRIGARLRLAEAALAHELLESRATTGKLILIP
ncbi:MAG: zinc-binding dehydrogenase, partial [Acidimicrobiales bacterium]